MFSRIVVLFFMSILAIMLPLGLSASQALPATRVAGTHEDPSLSDDAENRFVVRSDQRIAPISRLLLGVNMAAWYDITVSGLTNPMKAAGLTATRWPGGEAADKYHWKQNFSCGGGQLNSKSTFDNFEQKVAQPASLDVAITVNYGSNISCDAGGDPSEAASWVDYARQQGYHIKYWTVGNEEYGSFEYDLHSPKHSPLQYAQEVATGYYPLMKRADPQAQVGVTVQGTSAWDSVVLAHAKYDFVEIHYYAQAPGKEDDDKLLEFGPRKITTLINKIKSELTAAGRSGTPIYVGELGSVYANPGKQASSIVQALFAGMALGELMQDGVPRATWWIGYGGCRQASTGANFAPTLYGWQNFGGFMIFSDGIPEYGCPDATRVPRGTMLPTSRAFQLMSQVVRDGEWALNVDGPPTPAQVRAYAATHGKGYAIVLFNLDNLKPARVNLEIKDATPSHVYITTYGKAQYDRSAQNVWVDPVSQQYSNAKAPLHITLPAWSMSVVIAD